MSQVKVCIFFNFHFATFIDNVFQGADRSLNVTLVSQLLRCDYVFVTLQWPREAGAVYHVNIVPQTPHIQLTNAMTIMINLTVSYNTQYNVSIVSSLCGVTTTKVLNYGKYCKISYYYYLCIIIMKVLITINKILICPQ